MADRNPLAVRLGALDLASPVIAASGTFGYGSEYAGLVDTHSLGAVVTKGISLQPAVGNPPPRIAETPAGMLNAIGLQNVGLDSFVRDKMPFLRQLGVPVIVNMYGRTIDEYADLAGRLADVPGICALEANISCPNITQGGISFGTDPKMAHAVTAAVRAATPMPLIVKLTPAVTDITQVAVAVEEAGADVLAVANTFTGMVIDVEQRRPVLGNTTGGLSGPAIRPLALRLVWQTVARVSVPVIGVGGIASADDALQFLIAGASAVQMGTALFVDPGAPRRVCAGVRDYLARHGLRDLQECIGSLRQ